MSELIVLIATVNHPDRPIPALDQEVNQVLDRLRRWEASARGRGRHVYVPAASIDQIFEQFRTYRDRIAIFHFSGHAGAYELLVRDYARRPAAASAASLAAFLAEQRGLKLVVLNACNTAPQIQGLLDAGVLAVVAHTGPLFDDVACAFSVAFYTSLTDAAGISIEKAFREARARALAPLHDPALVRDVTEIAAPPNADHGFQLAMRPGAEDIGREGLWTWTEQWLLGIPPPPRSRLSPSPFRGLLWFGEDDAELFFGRDREIRELYDRVQGEEYAESPLVLVVGKEGVGKSSLLAAGLIPRLSARGFDVRYQRRGRAGLDATLRVAVVGSDAEDGDATAWAAVESCSGRPLVVVLDQAEGIFTQPAHAHERDAFFTQLDRIFGRSASRPRGKLLIGIRDAWLPDLLRELDRRYLGARVIYPVGPLGRDAIRQVVRGPTSTPRLRGHYNLQLVANGDTPIEDKIAGDLVDGRQPPSAIAPLAQLLLTRMWSEASKGAPGHPIFDENLYQRCHYSSLEDFITRQLQSMAGAGLGDAVESGLVLDVLDAHAAPYGAVVVEESELRKRYQGRDPEIDAIITALREAYLLTKGETPGSHRLSHDSLARAVALQFAASVSPGQRARRLLELRLEVSAAAPRVFDDNDLEQVERGKCGMRTWTAAEEQLVALSQAARAERLARENGRNQQDQEHRANIRNLKRLLLAGSAVATIVLAWVGIQWFRDNQRSQQELRAAVEQKDTALKQEDTALKKEKERTAEIRQEQAIRALDSRDASRAGAYLVDAWMSGGDSTLLHSLTDETSAVLRALNPVPGGPSRVKAIALMRDGTSFATGDERGHVRVSSSFAPTSEALEAEIASEVRSLEFDSSGRRLLVRTMDSLVVYENTAGGWSHHRLQTRSQIAGFGASGPILFQDDHGEIWSWDGMAANATSVRKAPDQLSSRWMDTRGGWLGTRDRNNQVTVEPLSGAHPVALATRHVADWGVFSEHAERVVTADVFVLGKRAFLWNTRTGSLVSELLGEHGAIRSAAFGLNDALVIGHDGERLFAWQPSGEVKWSKELEGQIRIFAVSADGRSVAVGNRRGHVTLLSTAAGLVLVEMQINADEIRDIRMSSDGEWLMILSSLGAVTLVRARLISPIVVDSTCEVVDFKFASDARTALCTCEEGTLEPWRFEVVDVATGQVTTKFSSESRIVMPWDAAQVSSDGQHIIFQNGFEDIRVGNIKEPANALPLKMPDGTTASASRFAVSPDGRMLATAGEPPVTALWRTSDRQMVERIPVDTGELSYHPTFCGNDRLITSSFGERRLRIWSTGPVRLINEAKIAFVDSVLCAGSGSRFLVEDRNVSRRLFDARTGVELRSFKAVADRDAVAFDSEARRIAVAMLDRVELVEGDSGKVLTVLEGDNPGVRSVRFVRGDLLATASARGVETWDVATGKRVTKLPDTEGAEMRVSVDGSRLAVWKEHQEGVRIWSLATARHEVLRARIECLATLRIEDQRAVPRPRDPSRCP